jgi:hypothetical protein
MEQGSRSKENAIGARGGRELEADAVTGEDRRWATQQGEEGIAVQVYQWHLQVITTKLYEHFGY